MKSKILILANTDKGIYNLRRELIEALLHRFEVIVSVPKGNDVEKIMDFGCKWIDCPYLQRQGTNPFQDGRVTLFYYQLIKRVRPALVLLYSIKPNIYGSFACRILDLPYINNVTGLGSAVQRKNWLAGFVLYLQKEAFRKSSCVFFQNNDNMDKFRHLDIVQKNAPLRLLPGSGVNLLLHSYEPYPSNDRVIRFVTVARIQRAKGYDELFDVARRTKKKYPNTEFHIVGRFEEEDYKDEVEHLAREGIIIYHGEKAQEEVHRLIAQCHCLVHPTYHEGMSNVCLEGAATGRPIIASDIPGCRETFDEGISGYGFQAQDANALYATVERFIHTPWKQQEQMGLRGRKKMEREFDRQIVVNAYLEEIEKITKKAS